MNLVQQLTDEYNQTVLYTQENSHKDGYLDGLKKAIELAKTNDDTLTAVLTDMQSSLIAIKNLMIFQDDFDVNITQALVCAEQAINGLSKIVR